MISFKQFVMLLEGGNIKVEGGQAAPFDSSARSTMQPEIRHALIELHNHVRAKHGVEMFGTDAAAVRSGKGFAGSTKHFFDPEIGHAEYAKVIPTTGDIDIQSNAEHAEKVKSAIAGLKGSKLGNFTVLGHKGHGTTTSMVMSHPKLEKPIQIDVEHVGYHGDHPHEGERFVNSSDFEDRRQGVKGVHHKLLLHAVAKEKGMKFSAGGGLKGEDEPGEARGDKHPADVSKRLFGEHSPHIHSFGGVAKLVRDHFTPEQQGSIAARFKETAIQRARTPEHTGNAINLLHKTFGLPESVNEQVEQEHHVATTVMTGVDPFTHTGHINDLGKLIDNLGGGFFAMSAKSSFPHKTREQIFSKQAKHAGLNVKPITVKENDDLINNAWNHVKDKPGKKVLHLVGGQDRKGMVERIADGMRAGKINNPGFHRIEVHTPEGEERTHGLSGTKMRTAAQNNDLHTFHTHLGPAFSRAEAQKHMNTARELLASGAMKVKRK